MKYLKLLLLALLLSSCSASKTLLKSLNKYQVSLEYLHDSEIKECNKSSTVALIGFDNQVLDFLTSVSKINYKLFPFIIYNYEEINLAVNLGQNSLEQNYYDFFKKSFATESQRTGCYSLIDNSNDSKYTVEIVFDTCKIDSKYQRSTIVLFFLFAASMREQEIGYPAKTNLVLNVKLKKETNLIFERKYSIEKVQPFLNTGNTYKLYSDFVTNMVESLSLSTKDCIEQLVIDINQVVEKDY